MNFIFIVNNIILQYLKCLNAKNQLVRIAKKIATDDDPEIKKELEAAKKYLKELNEKKN